MVYRYEKKNINRDSLWHSLMQDGIHGQSHIAMKSIYNQTQSAIKINDNMTYFSLCHKVSNKDAKSYQHCLQYILMISQMF